MSKALDPLDTPATWCQFLSNSVLLIWQSRQLQIIAGDFHKLWILMYLNIRIQ